MHLLELEYELDEAAAAKAVQLLDYETGGVQRDQVASSQFTVVPRLGTISPWSSKATDIFKLCGLHQVRRVERGVRWWFEPPDDLERLLEISLELFFDRMTETVLRSESYREVFKTFASKPIQCIELGDAPIEVLSASNQALGLALSADEIEYLVALYGSLERDPTDVELMMFAQANSEHCRHKIFNATWEVDGRTESRTLFQSIRHTAEIKQFAGLRSAYADNAAVIDGAETVVLQIEPESRIYVDSHQHRDVLMKVETHNHPTAIAPYAGAATGSGGEIRDEGSVGRGSKPKAGLVGFTTSHLRLQGDNQPWESELNQPNRIARPFEIMRDGPIGAAAYNNEYGRPALVGYFRTFESEIARGDAWGYHKPVMIAGGVGAIQREHIHAGNRHQDESELLIVLGGPAMLIGLGGGAASSMRTGASQEDLDFASVQRDNAEMERRCQEVIDRCTALGNANPIVKIHDVGAGGLSNALPELVDDLGRGATIDLKNVPNVDPGMSPMELWCNEAQERYVIALEPERLAWFKQTCQRERCPFAVVGKTNDSGRLVVSDLQHGALAVDLPMDGLLGKPPKMHRAYTETQRIGQRLVLDELAMDEAIRRVLRFPAVASKKFLVTIGDRSITGLVVQEQMVGAYQIPVADAAITSAGFDTDAGEVMTMGERSPIAVLDPAASARMAVGEAITNMIGAKIQSLEAIALSANWMAAAGTANEDQALREAVQAVGDRFCPALGIAIPVGKDSLSMSTQWDAQSVTSPLTLIVSAFATMPDVHAHKTPALRNNDSSLVLLTLSNKQRLGGSALAQVYSQLGERPPDIEEPQKLSAMFEMVQRHLDDGSILAVHDRSDGGLITTVLEQAIAGRMGVELDLTGSWQACLFNEEIGVVLEVNSTHTDAICGEAEAVGICAQCIGCTSSSKRFSVRQDGTLLYEESLVNLEKLWSQTSFEMQSRRDNPRAAEAERALIAIQDPGVAERLTYEPDVRSTPNIMAKQPLVAILRDQGVNGHLEMAAGFREVGFEAVDVHMTDLLESRETLKRFQVLAACGGFSYGDVLGGGGGWAKSILYSDLLRGEFTQFFERDTLTLGICNGCQMLAQLRSLIPGAEHWITWAPNASGRFEGRTVQVRVNNVSTPWLEGMEDSQLVVPVAHGEGRANVTNESQLDSLHSHNLIALQYVDGSGATTEQYPLNPNGSPQGVAGLVSESGKALVAMPHPERVFRAMQQTWRDPTERKTARYSGWIKMFLNAYEAVK